MLRIEFGTLLFVCFERVVRLGKEMLLQGIVFGLMPACNSIDSVRRATPPQFHIVNICIRGVEDKLGVSLGSDQFIQIWKSSRKTIVTVPHLNLERALSSQHVSNVLFGIVHPELEGSPVQI